MDTLQVYARVMRGTHEVTARGVPVLLAALAMVLCAAPPAQAGALTQSSLYWGSPSVIDSRPLTALSCPSSALCVGVDSSGDVLASRAPADGARAWRASNIDASPQPELYGVSCPEPAGSLCVAVGASGVFLSSHPTRGAGAWKRVEGLGGGGRAVSCTFDDALCVAAGSGSGELLVSEEPAEAASWKRIDFPAAGAVTSVSCPAQSLCLAAGASELLTSAHPAAGAGAWTASSYSGAPITKLACASASLCVGLGAGSLLASSDPGGGASTWVAQVASAESGLLDEVACAPAGRCIAAGLDGTILESSTPAGTIAAWRSERFLDGSNAITALSCASRSLCFAADEALLVGVGARQLSVTVKGLGTVRSTRADCPFGCTYSGSACPRDCAQPLPDYAVIPARPPAASCAASETTKGEDAGACSLALPEQARLVLSAEAEWGWSFTGWSGACSASAGCSLSMAGNRLATATFAQDAPVVGRCSCQLVPLAIGGFRETDADWRERLTAGARAGKQAPLGTSFFYELSRRASPTLSFMRIAGGCRHASAAGCAPRTPTGQMKLRFLGGLAHVRFDGRLAGHLLAPGRYAVTLTATADGERVQTLPLEFSIAQ